MQEARFFVLPDLVTALSKDARCTVTVIGRALPGSADKVSINQACNILLLLAALGNWFHYLLSAAVEGAGLHLRYQANTVTSKRVLALDYLGILLYDEPELPIRRSDYRRRITQIL